MIRKQRHVELGVKQSVVYDLFKLLLYAALLLFCQAKRKLLPEAPTATERWQRVATGTSEEGKDEELTTTSYGL